jgi:light-regulated signal transduction histidine kinase (bacteriophytochrome)
MRRRWAQTKKYRYAFIALGIAVLYCGLVFALHYAISSGTPAQLMDSSPAAAISIFLSLPIAFAAGFVWGADKDRRAKMDLLLKRQEDHLEKAESLSESLKQSEDARRMSAIAIREMKHPLTSIVGYALTLNEYWDRVDEDSRREFISFIKVSSSRLEGIANDLLRITEFGRLTPHIEKEQLNLGEIIDEVRLILEEIYRERNLKIGVRLPADLPSLNSDPSRLFDLFYNLLDICMRCTNDSQIVSLWCTCKEGEIQMRLRSTQSNISGDRILKLGEWPPAEGEGEFETLGMEYRLAQHLVSEVGGKLRLDAVGKTGISLMLSLPLQ